MFPLLTCQQALLLTRATRACRLSSISCYISACLGVEWQTPNACSGSVVFLLCGPCQVENRTFVAHLREVFLPRAQMGSFPRGASHLLVIVPDHFHIANYFNQSFSHMDSFLALVESYPPPPFFFSPVKFPIYRQAGSFLVGKGKVIAWKRNKSSLAFLCKMRSGNPGPVLDQGLMNISGGVFSFKSLFSGFNHRPQWLQDPSKLDDPRFQ